MQIQRPKNLIELAYQTAEKTGLALWNQDEAGPYQTIPYPGKSWEPESHPGLQPHEYACNGVAKILIWDNLHGHYPIWRLLWLFQREGYAFVYTDWWFPG